jgi:hypothetical protein
MHHGLHMLILHHLELLARNGVGYSTKRLGFEALLDTKPNLLRGCIVPQL